MIERLVGAEMTHCVLKGACEEQKKNVVVRRSYTDKYVQSPLVIQNTKVACILIIAYSVKHHS